MERTHAGAPFVPFVPKSDGSAGDVNDTAAIAAAASNRLRAYLLTLGELRPAQRRMQRMLNARWPPEARAAAMAKPMQQAVHVSHAVHAVHAVREARATRAARVAICTFKSRRFVLSVRGRA